MLEEIEIAEPYKRESCSGGNSMALSRVQMVVRSRPQPGTPSAEQALSSAVRWRSFSREAGQAARVV